MQCITGRGIKVDPTKIGEIGLYPAMGIASVHDPYLAAYIQVSTAEAIDYTGRNIQLASHNSHRGRVIGAVTMASLQEPGDGIDIAGNRRIIQSISKLSRITELCLKHLQGIVSVRCPSRPLLGR